MCKWRASTGNPLICTEPQRGDRYTSAFAVGAYLSQQQKGQERVIAYASMKFSRAQRGYSTIERELAAIRWAVHTFRGFIFGVQFDVVH